MERPSLAFLLIVAVSASVAGAQPEPVDFVRDVRPIFEEHCYECHGSEKRKGGLRLTNRRDAFLPGDLGLPVIEPSSAELSPLYELVASSDPEERMPKDADPLSAEEIETLRRWIDEGAVWPEDADAAPKTHWAYRRPARPDAPEVEDASWVRNEIDAFVLARLEQEGLRPAPEADRETAIRRVTFDLTGLPPTSAEVEAFLADESPEAWKRVVDRLLASPRFGERWASPWLDLARYADSVGFQSDQLHSNWPYRDWVIQAINDDVPFDRFTIEQIAGDLLPEPTVDQRIATGLHRSAPLNLEAGAHVEESRVQQVMDRVNVTSTVWLGSTIECAQCHNHKYDPFTQEEYYRLFAFFNNTPIESTNIGPVSLRPGGPRVRLPLEEERVAERRKLLERVDAMVEEADALRETDSSTQKLAGQYFRKVRKQRDLGTTIFAATNLLRAAAAAKAPPGAVDEWRRAKLDALRAGNLRWVSLNVDSFESTGNEDHEVLRDGSVLIGGPVPDTSVYEIRGRTKLRGITGLRLEVLRHRSLPGSGPGRGDEAQPDFVLSELEVELERPGSEPLHVRLHSAESARTGNAGVGAALDGDAATGWTVGRPYQKMEWATFVLDEPIDGEDGTVFRITLAQNDGFGRTIGRFRLLATAADPELVAMGDTLARAFVKGDLSKKQQRDIARLYETSLLGPEVARQIREMVWRVPDLTPPSALVMVEDTPRETHVLKRGDYLSPGAVVSPATPAVLHPMREEWPKNRLGLARWLVDPENPLVGRVTVNRWWAELFGRGLVRTPEDFGVQGEPPTHPELLDWLAVELVERGWSRKAILREIVTSATYRQASLPSDPALLQSDPDNRLLARNPRLRLPAEQIRDNALAIAGLLSPKMGGPPVFPPQPEGVWKLTGNFQPRYETSMDEDRYRRALYTIWRRSSLYPSFQNFDARDRTACVVARPRTNTPLQALTLMNDEVYVEAAMGLARRILAERPDDGIEERLRHGFRLAVTRSPDEEEIEVLAALYEAQRGRLAQDPGAASEILKPFPVPEDLDAREVAAWFFVANALLNLDESITRG